MYHIYVENSMLDGQMRRLGTIEYLIYDIEKRTDSKRFFAIKYIFGKGNNLKTTVDKRSE